LQWGAPCRSPAPAPQPQPQHDSMADPCMLRLGSVMLHACLKEPCSAACCEATVEPAAACSPAWLNEFRVFAHRERVRIAGKCQGKCMAPLPCLFAGGTPSGTPCTHPACSNWNNGTVAITHECRGVVKAHCATAGGSVCTYASHCPASQWYDCAAAGRPSLVGDALAQVSVGATRGTHFTLSGDVHHPNSVPPEKSLTAHDRQSPGSTRTGARRARLYNPSAARASSPGGPRQTHRANSSRASSAPHPSQTHWPRLIRRLRPCLSCSWLRRWRGRLCFTRRGSNRSRLRLRRPRARGRFRVRFRLRRL